MSTGDLVLRCSFCGKTQKQVKKLIAGPGVYICDECIDLCNEILDDEGRPRVKRMPLSEEERSTSPTSAEPHLVGVAEIADMLSVSRQRVAQLVSGYDDFPRAEAEIAAGRIWSRAAVETWIAAHPERRPGRSLRSELNLLTRLDKDAQEAMRSAAESARSLGHDATGTEHLLLGLFEPPGSAAARVLAEVEIKPERVRERVEEMAPAGTARDDPPAPDPSVKRVVELAALAAFKSASPEIDTAHLLLGILQDPHSTAARILTGLGPTLGFIADRIYALQRSSTAAQPAATVPVMSELVELVRMLTAQVARLQEALPPRDPDAKPSS